MRAGEFDRQIALLRESLHPTDGGDPGEKWDPYALVYAKVEPLFGTESWRGGSDVRLAEADTAFTIRYREAPLVTDRILYGTKTYDIIAVIEEGRHEGIRITGRARTGEA